jgi:hypothetical protein
MTISDSGKSMVHVRVTEEQHRRLLKTAKYYGWTITGLVQLAIVEFLDKTAEKKEKAEEQQRKREKEKFLPTIEHGFRFSDVQEVLAKETRPPKRRVAGVARSSRKAVLAEQIAARGEKIAAGKILGEIPEEEGE